MTVVVGYRRGMNPDDLVGPAVTTAGGVFGMLSLLAASDARTERPLTASDSRIERPLTQTQLDGAFDV